MLILKRIFIIRDFIFPFSNCRYASTVPSPRSGISNTNDFFKRIGRDTAEKVNGKFESWDGLFRKSTKTMKKEGIDVRTRKYIASQRNRFKEGFIVKPYPVMVKKNGGERRKRK
ncbi:Protein fyv4, mitochondrial [Schizosaccharomyces pombe]